MPYPPSRIEGTPEERADLPLGQRLNDCRDEAGRIADLVATMRLAVLWEINGCETRPPKYTCEPLSHVVERALQDLMAEAECIRNAHEEGERQ